MDLLIFDLDGTLIDSKIDLANAVNAARGHLGLTALTNDLIHSYVGEGAPILIQRALGPAAAPEDVARALAFFLEYYRAHQLEYTVLYPGVREALDRLKAYGAKLAILTNKPVRISHEIADGLGLASHFEFIYGGNSFEFKKPHPIGIETLIAATGAPRERTIMVGDSGVDIRTARNANVQACGVTYGFQPETFIEYPPDFTVDEMGQLADRIIPS
jgi:phosphoglycolate phosphatase